MHSRTQHPRSVRVVVVDDDPDSCLATALLLATEGFSVQVASSDPAALRRLRHSRPDAVVVDIVQPAAKGLRVLRLLRADPALKHSFLIAISALPELLSIARATGTDACLLKPVDARELVACAVHLRPDICPLADPTHPDHRA